MTEISLYTNKDQNALFDLIKKSISTPRTKSSWEGNHMTAILAWDDDKLIGALPLEKREFSIGNDNTIKLLWISAAHVEPEYRSKGIGFKMDSFLRKYYENEFDAICAYREDERSKAYRWYQNMGFHSILPILAFKKSVNKGSCEKKNRLILNSIASVNKYGEKLHSCFEKTVRSQGGFTKRNEKYWSRVFEHHYYSDLYEFIILAMKSHKGGFDAFALLGKTDMKDGVKRYDILEFVATSEKTSSMLHDNIELYAHENNINELRIQTFAVEPMKEWVNINGYEYRNRRTNILASLINPSKYLGECYLKTTTKKMPELKIETPMYKHIHVMGDGKEISLFMNDDTLHQLMFNRLDIEYAVNQGKIVLLQGCYESLLKVSELFHLSPWRYFQSDYI